MDSKTDQKLGQTVTASNLANRTIQVEDDRTGMSVETLKRAFADNLFYLQGKDESNATLHDYYQALAFTVRDRLLRRFIKTGRTLSLIHI
jgi:starch phosphorylase